MKTSPIPNAAADWFRASEGAGDFVGIRFGRIPNGCDEVEWHYVSHAECDGVGAFGRLLRELGLEVGELPQGMHSCRGVMGPLWRLWRASRKAKREAKHEESEQWAVRDDWESASDPNPPKSVAWHVFSEAETAEVLATCKREQVTVNSKLLWGLDRAVRPDIRRSQRQIPWMIPVNLRGDLRLPDDTANHVSCVEVRVASDVSVAEIQRQVHEQLARGEHRAYHLLMQAGRLMSHEARVRHLQQSRSKPHGNIGAFSNLGSWDASKALDTQDQWLFCPPCTMGQMLAAGCVTFQGRLSLMLQSHLEEEKVKEWMGKWLGSIGCNCPV